MKIIGIAGKKEAGKNTVANIMHGIVLKQQGMVKDFNIGSHGELLINTQDSTGKEGWGEWDITRKDEPFMEYAEYNMWPHVKLYSYADSLKKICVDLFQVPYKNLYGSHEDKNQIIPHLLWENMPGIQTKDETPSYEIYNMFGICYHKPGPMTAREFLQFFGTEIMRKIWSPVWCKDTIRRIKNEDSEVSIIADVRFPNEVQEILENDGVVIKLTRNIHVDSHESENVLDEHNFDQGKFTHILKNGGKYTLERLQVDIKRIFNSIVG